MEERGDGGLRQPHDDGNPMARTWPGQVGALPAQGPAGSEATTTSKVPLVQGQAG